MSRTMQDSGIPWVGSVPSDWGIALTSSLFHEHKEKNIGMKENNLLSLSYGNIIRKNINTNEGLLPQSFETYNVIEVNDIVFRLTDLQNDKRSLRTGLCRENGIITSAYVTIRPSVDLDSRFFHYLFHSYDVCKVFYGMGEGVRQGMGYDDVKKMKVIIPSLPEQQAIADYLDKKCSEIDELISLQEKIIDELTAYKQSIITEAVTKGLNPDVPMKDSGIEWIGKIPERWVIKRLKFFASRYNEKVGNQKLPYIGLENIESFSEKYIETDSQYDISQAMLCRIGDVIFGKLRPYLGKAMVIKEPSCCSSEFIVLKSEVPRYLRYLMLSNGFIEVVNASTYGTKMPRANADFIMNMSVVCPSEKEQQVIVSFLDKKCSEIDEMISIKQSKIEALKEYKKSLIYECVTGKKDVI